MCGNSYRIQGKSSGGQSFKDDHKMANQAISGIINKLPPPFDVFCGVIWNGLEEKKQDDSGEKMLLLLEKMQKNEESTFLSLSTDIDLLLKKNASKEDLQKLGEEIINSNRSY